MAQKDYYKDLEIDKNATEEDIRKSYKKLARQWHPDKWVNGTDEEKKNAEEKFKEIAEAYSVLSDKEKRQKYDMYGTVDGNPFEGFQSTGMGDLDDILEMFRTMHGGAGFGFGGFGGGGFGFGGNARRSANQVVMPEPLQIHLRVTISEIYTGATKHVKYKYMGACGTCNGTGHLEGGKKEACPHCQGTGMMTKQVRNGYMTSITQTVCPYCGGTGQSVTNPCGKCNGTGLEVQYDEIDLEIPAGVCDGAYIQINGKGNCAKYHTDVRGVLVVIFDVVQDSRYQIVKQYDLQTQVDVPILDCITGCQPEVETVDGKKYTFKMEPGAETGKIITLKGMGMKRPDGSRGNMLIKIKQRFPKSVSKSEMKKIEELKKTLK